MFNGFSGGVHPPEEKKTEKLAIEVMPSPKRVYIHFSQHTGKPAHPLVQKDDIVKIGTKIGESDGFISVPIHSSISGKVISLATHPHPVLGSSPCCIIESTDSDEWEQGVKENQDYENLTREELLNIIKEVYYNLHWHLLCK